MKKLTITLFITICILFSCNAGESLEAYIENSSSSELTVIFFSEKNNGYLNDILNIKPNERVLYTEAESFDSAYFSFNSIDSIYIKNSSDEILKVFKIDSANKNIYNIDKYWTTIETSKNHYIYTYEIKQEDIE